ncbi:isochorismatase family protein [Rosenbergiella australiborealis]|uniref:Isochorismatase family protein n=1 Tax=Rosenbergiella australiborealis TaxID=1544696 RepID=A0ABS5T4F6_9GAMM|nr:isochorismatase family protein [Rosenbergiella australiborealis]MBT0727216.1 isochorismatase family protein [Rosenbergiella australiborealis]
MKQALLIIDMQEFIHQRQQAGCGLFPHNAIENGQTLLDKYREAKLPIIHIFHHDLHSEDPLHPDRPAAVPLAGYQPLPQEIFFIKHHSSAFSHTGLNDYLHTQGITQLIVIGAVTGFCVNSTVRAAADLGFKVTVIEDATLSFSLPNPDLTAELLWKSTLGLLAADFAHVMTLSEWMTKNENYLK